MQNKKVIKSSGSAVSSVAFMNSLAALTKTKKKKGVKNAAMTENDQNSAADSENTLRSYKSNIGLGGSGLDRSFNTEELQQNCSKPDGAINIR